MASVFTAIGRPDNKVKLEASAALNSDIVSAILKNFPAAVEEVRRIAPRFKGHNIRATARNVWDFLRGEISYNKDAGDVQVIRMPRKLLSSRRGDCKSYSLFAASVLAALGYKVAFRFASYSGIDIPTHVYTTVKDENGHTVIVDGVYNHFDSEKKPTYKKDHAMKVYTISGHSSRGYYSTGRPSVTYSPLNGIGKFGDGIKRLFKKIKTKVQDKKKSHASSGKGGVFKKIAFAPSRGPFLALVRLNVHGFASHLLAAIKKNPNGVKALWSQKLGGDYNQLVKTVNEGAKRKKIFGLYGIGVDPATLTTLAAAAASIKVVMDWLKSNGIIGGKESEAIIDQAEGDLEDQGIDPEDVSKSASSSSTSYGFEISPPLILGAGVGLYLLTR